jgi:hypothetical protein
MPRTKARYPQPDDDTAVSLVTKKNLRWLGGWCLRRVYEAAVLIERGQDEAEDYARALRITLGRIIHEAVRWEHVRVVLREAKASGAKPRYHIVRPRDEKLIFVRMRLLDVLQRFKKSLRTAKPWTINSLVERCVEVLEPDIAPTDTVKVPLERKVRHLKLDTRMWADISASKAVNEIMQFVFGRGVSDLSRSKTALERQYGRKLRDGDVALGWLGNLPRQPGSAGMLTDDGLLWFVSKFVLRDDPEVVARIRRARLQQACEPRATQDVGDTALNMTETSRRSVDDLVLPPCVSSDVVDGTRSALFARLHETTRSLRHVFRGRLDATVLVAPPYVDHDRLQPPPARDPNVRPSITSADRRIIWLEMTFAARAHFGERDMTVAEALDLVQTGGDLIIESTLAEVLAVAELTGAPAMDEHRPFGTDWLVRRWPWADDTPPGSLLHLLMLSCEHEIEGESLLDAWPKAGATSEPPFEEGQGKAYDRLFDWFDQTRAKPGLENDPAPLLEQERSHYIRAGRVRWEADWGRATASLVGLGLLYDGLHGSPK